MENQFIKTIKSSINHWYLPLIIGIVFILLGIYTMMSPEASFLALSIFFSLSFLFSGLSEIIFSISNKDEIENWGWTLALGLMTTFIGLLLLSNPAMSELALTLYIGFIILFRASAAISHSLDLKKYGIKEWSTLMAIGLLGVIFALILLWNPLFAGMTAILWIGIALITLGVFNIFLSLMLKKLKNFPNKVSEELKEKLRRVKEEIEAQLHS